MTKIIMYSARPDEKTAVQQWSKKNNVEVKMVPEPMDENNINLIDGYDGLSLDQFVPLQDPAIYERIAKAGIKNLAARSTGYELYNLDAAKQNGITVTNVPAYSPRSVAEHTLALTMNSLRHIPLIQRREHANDFSWAGTEAFEIHNLTVGIIGAGKIGGCVARIFTALGAHVIAYDPIHRPELEDCVEYTDVDTLLESADVVTMHTPLTKDMTHFMDKKRFAQMKNSAIFINASRGGVVNTPDLIQALKDHQIAAAGLDTVEDEGTVFAYQIKDSSTGNHYIDALKQFDNVILTPHIAFYTDVAVSNLVQITLDNALQVIEGKTPEHPVN